MEGKGYFLYGEFMKRKLKLTAFAAILFAALSFSSCRARPCLKINCFDLPADMNLKVLVQIEENDPNYRDNPKAGEFFWGHTHGGAVTELDSASDSSCGDSGASSETLTPEEKYEAFLEEVNAVGEEHLYNYNEDGWRSADYYMSGDAYTLDYKFYFPFKYDHARDFVYAYPKLRVAAVDENGRVERVSDIANMMPEDKFAVYTGLDYSYESNTLTPSDMSYRRVNGKAPDHNLIWFLLLLIVCNIAAVPLLVVMLAAYNTGNDHRNIGFVLMFILLSAGNILFTADSLKLELVPKYDLAGDGFTYSDLKTLLFVNAVWIIEFIVFCVIFSRPKKPKNMYSPYIPVDTAGYNQYNERNRMR